MTDWKSSLRSDPTPWLLECACAPIRYRVLIDGKPPGADHGMDIDAAGNGRVADQRLYQLIRQKDPGRERLFTIEFLDAGAEAYAFTFG